MLCLWSKLRANQLFDKAADRCFLVKTLVGVVDLSVDTQYYRTRLLHDTPSKQSQITASEKHHLGSNKFVEATL